MQHDYFLKEIEGSRRGDYFRVNEARVVEKLADFLANLSKKGVRLLRG